MVSWSESGYEPERNWWPVTTSAYRDAGFACVRPRLDVMPADLGLSARPPGAARPLRMSHASCEEAVRPSPGDAPVQLYDIK